VDGGDHPDALHLVIFLRRGGRDAGQRAYPRRSGLLLIPAKCVRPLPGCDLVLFAFCLAVAWHGIELVASTMQMNFRLKSSGVSMFWPYLIIPVSFGLQALRLALWHMGLRD
jgi:hypothetical protein